MISWHETWMNIAKEIAKRSKDPSTKVGAVIVKDKKLLSIGYNGAPKKFNDLDIPNSKKENDVPMNLKNTYMVHAEVNAILNHSGSLSDFKDAVVYVTVSPCYECAKVLSQVGIKEVIYDEEYHKSELWKPSKYILEKCGIKVTKYSELL